MRKTRETMPCGQQEKENVNFFHTATKEGQQTPKMNRDKQRKLSQGESKLNNTMEEDVADRT